MTTVLRWLAVVGLGLGAGGVRFDPEAGTQVERTFAFESELGFEGWTVVWNGQEVPAEFLPELAVEVREEARAVVRDAVLECAEGRVNALQRSFEGLGAREVFEVSLSGAPIEERDAEGTCALEDCTVRFENGARVLVEGEAPAEALAGLELDLDFTALLEGGRDGAQAWQAPAEALVPACLPGGIAFEFAEVPEEERAAAEQWLANLTGTWRVRPLESREDGRLQAFALAGELSTWSVRATDLDDVPIVEGDATETTNTEWKAEGELVWDVERRTLSSLSVEAELRSTVVTVRDLEGIEGEPTYEQTMRLVGRSKLTCEVR